jgi:hypothetical protein
MKIDEKEKEISQAQIIQQSQPFISKKKSRIVLLDEEGMKFNLKDRKNYAMDFESLYDNYERDVDFVDKIDSLNQNSLNSENNFSGSFKKKSSIIPYGKKPSKKDDLIIDKFNNYEIEEFFIQENNSPLKRKSSILSILETNLNNKRNLNEYCD